MVFVDDIEVLCVHHYGKRQSRCPFSSIRAECTTEHIR